MFSNTVAINLTHLKYHMYSVCKKNFNGIKFLGRKPKGILHCRCALMAKELALHM